MKINSIKSSSIATGGIYSAMGFICVYLSSILPINKLYLLAIASAIIPIAVLSTNIKNGLLVYISTSILCSIIIGIGRGTVIAYIVFFGLYGIVKYYIEKFNKLSLEIIFKLLFFNICLLILFFIYKFFFPAIPILNQYIYIYVIIAQVVFIIFDYVLTMFIFYIQKHFIRLLKN